MLEKSKPELESETLVNLTTLEGNLREENTPMAEQDHSEIRYFLTSLRIMGDTWIDQSREERT